MVFLQSRQPRDRPALLRGRTDRSGGVSKICCNHQLAVLQRQSSSPRVEPAILRLAREASAFTAGSPVSLSSAASRSPRRWVWTTPHDYGHRPAPNRTSGSWTTFLRSKGCPDCRPSTVDSIMLRRCLRAVDRREGSATSTRPGSLSNRLVEDVVEPSHRAPPGQALELGGCRAPVAACPQSHGRRPARRESAGYRPGSASCAGSGRPAR